MYQYESRMFIPNQVTHHLLKMPHADSATLPAHIRTKAEFWDHVHAELNALLVVQRHWVLNF